MKMLLSGFVVLACVLASECALLKDAVSQDIRIFTEKVFVLDELMSAECPTYTRQKRDVATVNHPVHLEVLKITYNKMFKELMECRRINYERLHSTSACGIATNITDAWRKNHEGKDFKPGGVNSYNGYACDLHRESTWFRFAGAAGSKMLDSCPKEHSCGTYMSYWTDDEMPTEIGVAKTVNAYGSLSGKCDQYSRPVQVMRCSAKSNDFIYKVVKPLNQLTCREAFCGMD